MKAIVVTDPESGWKVAQAAEPEPGPRDVVVRIEASGICFTDVSQLRKASFGMTFPRIPGHEPVGIVEQVGSDVDDVAVGDRVGTAYCQHWCGHCGYCARGRYEHCLHTKGTGVTIDGGHAELCVMDAGAVERVPDGIDPVDAAPIFCAGFTVYSGLVDAEIRPGDRCAIVGVGGLGHLGIQYAAALGAEVFAVTRSAAKVDELRALGAHEVVVADADDIGRQLALRGGVDAIVATANGLDPRLLDGLRPYGRLALVGQGQDPLTLTSTAMISGKHTVHGSSQGPRSRLGEVLALHQRSGARTMTETYGFDQALFAFDRVANGEARFRAVLTP
jgi:D-arabinose 1-dehydrogenase-like Zn-dependent alcohol dehydrogenase